MTPKKLSYVLKRTYEKEVATSTLWMMALLATHGECSASELSEFTDISQTTLKDWINKKLLGFKTVEDTDALIRGNPVPRSKIIKYELLPKGHQVLKDILGE